MSALAHDQTDGPVGRATEGPQVSSVYRGSSETYDPIVSPSAARLCSAGGRSSGVARSRTADAEHRDGDSSFARSPGEGKGAD